MWIVKLGGSLLGSPELAHWLAQVVKFGDGKVVIVPGGGLFADAVREAQLRSNVSDAVAHELALIAMDQFGILLAGMNPALTTASSELEIAECGWQHRAIVWLPSKMVLADDTIPKNWQVTSDSLSAWLANKLGAEQLILVKSKPLTYQKKSSVSLQRLIEDELVDSQFEAFIGREKHEQAYRVWLVNKADYTMFEQGYRLQKLEEYGFLVNN
ncbi:MAG: uridylate kinase [Betaproteobacteria bacterium]